MDINTICICGAGTMGSGIAQVSAMAGFHTILYELNNEVLQKAKLAIGAGLQILVDKNKITPEKKQENLSNILFTNDLQLCLADVFIEAIVEKVENKIALFNQLAELNHSETIFASNTSSLSISSIAEKVNNPQRVAGLHFFNPAPVMKLVEVVKARQTDPEVINRLIQLTKELDKTPVVCKDSPGFIVNRVARPFYIESLRLAEEGLSNFEVIDRLLESRGFKLGPFKLMDLIGNDINYTVSCSVYEQLGQPERFKPSPIQKEKLDRGELGRKTKKGYYNYE
ncbi:MAG TPA: 3-hydroxyacyl-CoA dehydrogenase NAD-binding domain-containing protein [Chitinophagaceae bacterium]|nr:3-hydroxyacyl-CoA dehydrogenase NAD-binding domain-containing protein [Chitinophagaceae bacterium]